MNLGIEAEVDIIEGRGLHPIPVELSKESIRAAAYPGARKRSAQVPDMRCDSLRRGNFFAPYKHRYRSDATGVRCKRIQKGFQRIFRRLQMQSQFHRDPQLRRFLSLGLPLLQPISFGAIYIHTVVR